MILDLKLTDDNKVSPSSFIPSEKVKKRTKEVMTRFQRSFEMMNKPYDKFNDQSVLQIRDDCRKLFLNWREPKSLNPDEAWKSRALRPIVRNRVISVAAHATATLMTPNVQAQNDNQQEDKDSALIMKDLIEYANDKADYHRTLLFAVITAEVEPTAFIHTGYEQNYRTIKEINEKGTWTEKKVLDEEMSGFRDSVVPLDEIFLGDMYEYDVQKQPYIIWRKAIQWETAVAKYGDNETFKKYVQPGLQAVFDQETSSFYELVDESLKSRLVEEITYYDRYQDLKLVFCNGILITDINQPNPRQDKKYPFIALRYELHDGGKFFHGFSLVRKTKDDAEVLTTTYRMFFDAMFLKGMPPTAIYGDEVVNASVVTPGTVNTFKETTKLEKIDVGGDLGAISAGIDRLEKSIGESSQDVLQMGLNEEGGQTAFEISRREQNARTILGLFGKMIGYAVKEWGDLRVSDILQYMTIGEVNELVDKDAVMKYPRFFIPDKVNNGTKKTRQIVFDGELPDEMTDEDIQTRKFDNLREAGGIDADTEIYKVNPTVFRMRKFRTVVTPDVITPPSDALKKAYALELYNTTKADPWAKGEELYKLVLESYEQTKYDVAKYVREQPMGMPTEGGQGSVLSKMFGGGAERTANIGANQSRYDTKVV